MPITYVVGDATHPLENGEANCPCIVLGETACPVTDNPVRGGHCYHFTGEGVCNFCNGTGKMREDLLNAPGEKSP